MSFQVRFSLNAHRYLARPISNTRFASVETHFDVPPLQRSAARGEQWLDNYDCFAPLIRQVALNKGLPPELFLRLVDRETKLDLNNLTGNGVDIVFNKLQKEPADPVAYLNRAADMLKGFHQASRARIDQELEAAG